jgi:hypothetical protein
MFAAHVHGVRVTKSVEIEGGSAVRPEEVGVGVPGRVEGVDGNDLANLQPDGWSAPARVHEKI